MPFFGEFMNLKVSNNEIMLYSDYCLHQFQLPVSFNRVSEDENGKDRIEVNVHIPYAIINEWAPITTVEPGHRYACLLQFKTPVPLLFRTLPEVRTKPTIHRKLYLYTDVDPIVPA
jgi:hypothetical protein